MTENFRGRHLPDRKLEIGGNWLDDGPRPRAGRKGW